MGKNPLVSIIVPVYGTEAYLPACIDSIRNQSYQNLQIILVDDQSPDRCPEICDSYAQKDPRIQVIHQNNTGVSGARNTGLQQVTGEYVLFVDSDDELFPNAVEILLRDAQGYGADIVSATKRIAGDKESVRAAGEDGRITESQDEDSLLLSLGGDRNTNSACAKLFKTALIRDIRFVEGMNINEDGFFMFQCYLKKPVLVQHNIAVYQYNTRPGSASRSAFSEKYLDMLYFCERKKELIAEHCPQYTEQAHNMEVRTNLQLLDVMCRTTDKKYKSLEKQCIQTVRSLYRYHKPISKHHRMLAWITSCALFPVYKRLVRFKHKRSLRCRRNRHITRP